MEHEETLGCVEVHAPLYEDHGEHDHGHGDIARGDRRLVIAALAVTGAVMLAELAGGLLTKSLALVSDSLHMFTHFISLLIALGAMWAASLPRNWTRTFGLFRAEVLAALINGFGLLVFSIYISYEAYTRLIDRTEVNAGPMLVVAFMGLLANLVSAYLLYKARRRDLNLKGAMAHMLADTLSSGAVIVVGFVMLIWPIYELDAAVSVLISILVAIWSYRIIRDSTRILLELTPRDMDLEKVKKRMMEVDDVMDVHDIHAWEITSGMRCMTCHVMISPKALKEDAGQVMMSELRTILKDDYQVVHTTFQMECGPEVHSGG
jgi:cobalt-zinc-cadmium efflux system protein